MGESHARRERVSPGAVRLRGGCPGNGNLVAYGLEEVGGGVGVTNRTLLLQFLGGTSQAITVVSIEATISGATIQLTLPPGALNVAASTTLGFTLHE